MKTKLDLKFPTVYYFNLIRSYLILILIEMNESVEEFSTHIVVFKAKYLV